MSPSKHQRILQVVDRIPPGCVATYGQVAAMAGLPGHARMVGYALAANGERVPWHRVINAKGEVSPRASPEWEAIQRTLLEREGVVFRGDGRIDLKRYRWDPGRDGE